MDFKVGEIVTRLSYENDIVFRIASLSHKEAILHGEEIRLVADSLVVVLLRLENGKLEKGRKRGKDGKEFYIGYFVRIIWLCKKIANWKKCGKRGKTGRNFHIVYFVRIIC